jgi:hypothetical protein
MKRTLTDADVEAIASRLAEMLGMRGQSEPKPDEALSVKEVAQRLGVRPQYVYANAERLGGYRLGDGPKARWRFDPASLPASPGAVQVAEESSSPRRRSRARRQGRRYVAPPQLESLDD